MRDSCNCYQLSRNSTRLRMWWFGAKSRHVVMTTTLRPGNGQTRRERYDTCIKDGASSGPPAPARRRPGMHAPQQRARQEADAGSTQGECLARSPRRPVRTPLIWRGSS